MLPEKAAEIAMSPWTFGALLRHRAVRQPDRIGYTFLEDGERERSTRTYGELMSRAQRVAAALVEVRARRALVLLPPGLDYLDALFGCMYAGVTAVPLKPPDPTSAQDLATLTRVLADSRASVVLTLSSIERLVRPLLPTTLGWIAADTLPAAAIGRCRCAPEDVALIVYPSSLSNRPRGVGVLHHHLARRAVAIGEAIGGDLCDRTVSWMPPYHGAGLTHGILQPMFGGFPATLMAPKHFLARPARWLEALSREQATISGAPSSAYELCARAVPLAQRSALDLRSWRVALADPEPQHQLERFILAFSRSGFSRHALHAAAAEDETLGAPWPLWPEGADLADYESTVRFADWSAHQRPEQYDSEPTVMVDAEMLEDHGASTELV